MKRKIQITFIWVLPAMVLLMSGCGAKQKFDTANRNRIFNLDWKFNKVDLQEAGQPGFDDSGWQRVDLPHDWSIWDLPGEDSEFQIGPFSLESPGGGATAYALGGTAWYRKHFKMAEEDAGKRVILCFDGVYMDSEVWVNGTRAGNHPYGYTAFWFDITPFLNDVGKDNVVAVQVNNLGHNARWYSGSGIYRNVSLLVTNPLHVAVDGVYITTPEISEASAEVRLQVTVNNKSGQTKEAGISVKLLDPEGAIVGETSRTVLIDPDGSTVLTEKVNVKDPRLWALSSPNLYTAEVTVRDGKAISDVSLQTFGIRSVEISVDKGFVLNGEPLILKGGCMHHDNGLLGAAAIDRAEERRVEIMKANGFNAIRCSHNPPSKAFLDACDRLGMLVIDEIFDVWEQPKFMPDGAHLFFDEWWERDVESWILRDRNHPSVVMWSIGNEIMEAADSTGLSIARQLIDEVKALDPSRPVSEAMQDMQGVFMGRSGWYDQEEHMALLDVVGYNYKDNCYVKDHELYPKRIIYGSETFPLTSFEYWQLTEQLPYVIGDFVWTGMDYLGESALGNTDYVPEGTPEPPNLSDIVNSGVPLDMESMSAFMGALPEELPVAFVAWCGDIDITGEKKPQMYYKDILWDNSLVEMLVHEPIPEGMIERTSFWGWPAEKHSWNWSGNEGTPLNVRVFTKGDRVVLELNGEKIGERTVSADTRYTAEFEVPFQPGELKAIAYQEGHELASKLLRTTGEIVGIHLVADRTSIHADRNDLSFISVLAVDENGQTVTDASIQVTFSISGNGELAASGNADPQDMASVNSRVVRTYDGRAQVIIRPFEESGTILLRASSEGLAPAELEISVK